MEHGMNHRFALFLVSAPIGRLDDELLPIRHPDAGGPTEGRRNMASYSAGSAKTRMTLTAVTSFRGGMNCSNTARRHSTSSCSSLDHHAVARFQIGEE